MSKVIGIDISKATFDVCFLSENVWKHSVFTNDLEGFKKFIAQIGTDDHCVMEASGPYYLPLATYLYQAGIALSVVNPLVIRRFCQMRLKRAKTDKKDAQAIAEYALTNPVKTWEPEPEAIVGLKQLFAAIQLISKQEHMTRRQLEAFGSSGSIGTDVKKALKAILSTLKAKREQLGQRMIRLAHQHYKGTIEQLQTIPGIGPKTAVLLTAITQNFEKFEHSRQLIAYVGFSPRVFHSGSSIRGKGHICKMGKSSVRKQLYMCTWTAKRYNKGCQTMYERLKAKGKPERVIKIAIANKLLKQAFAIIKHNTIFNENYVPKPCF